MHMMRADSDSFVSFGEMYFSTVNKGVVKGWKRHKKMILNIAVPFGSVQFTIYDDRPDSLSKGKIQQVFLTPDNYALLSIAPMLWVGFKGLSDEPAIIANCASIMHDPDEADQLDINTDKIPFNWE